MALAPGSTLGPYEIRSQLGQGGMGVVYLAQQRLPPATSGVDWLGRAPGRIPHGFFTSLEREAARHGGATGPM